MSQNKVLLFVKWDFIILNMLNLCIIVNVVYKISTLS